MSFFANAIYCDGATAPIDKVDTIQKHSLGTRMILEDGRVFAYAKAGANITTTDMGLKNLEPQGTGQRVVAAAQAVGDRTVTVTCASPDGLARNGEIVEDEFEGGYILFFTAAAATSQMRRITGNTAGTTSIVFTFDRGLRTALTESDHVECMHSPYVNVGLGSGAWEPVVGLATVTCSEGEYLWIQTWGICWVSPRDEAGLAGALGLAFRHDGGVTATYTGVTWDNTSQYAGYCISPSLAGAQAAPFFMLQLAP